MTVGGGDASEEEKEMKTWMEEWAVDLLWSRLPLARTGAKGIPRE